MLQVNWISLENMHRADNWIFEVCRTSRNAFMSDFGEKGNIKGEQWIFDALIVVILRF